MMQRAPDRIVAWARTGMLSQAVRTCLRPVRAGRGLARSSQLLMPSRCMSNYPAHTVVGLPALSPTMTHGNLAKWLKKEGETIGPGDVICEIETDKATVDFEAQDEGIVAKLLVKESTSDIPVGAPIFVMVEEASSVAAFADFTVSHSPAAAPKAEAPVAAPAPAPAKPTTPPPPPKAVAAPAPPPPAPKPVPKPEVAPATAAAAPAAPIPDSLYAFKRWGSLGRDGPLAKRLVKMQKEYVKAYGPTLTEVSP